MYAVPTIDLETSANPGADSSMTIYKFLKQDPSLSAMKTNELPCLRTDFAHPATLISVSIKDSWSYQSLATLTLCPYPIGATGLSGIASFLSMSSPTGRNTGAAEKEAAVDPDAADATGAVGGPAYHSEKPLALIMN